MKSIKIPLIDTAIMHYDEKYKDILEFSENFLTIKSKNRRHIDADLPFGVNSTIDVDQEVAIMRDYIAGVAVMWNNEHECFEVNIMNGAADIFFLFNNRDFALDLKRRVIDWINGKA